MLTYQEIKNKVYERYPKNEEERKCRTAADRMNGLRETYRQKLYEQNKLHSESLKEDKEN